MGSEVSFTCLTWASLPESMFLSFAQLMCSRRPCRASSVLLGTSSSAVVYCCRYASHLLTFRPQLSDSTPWRVLHHNIADVAIRMSARQNKGRPCATEPVENHNYIFCMTGQQAGSISTRTETLFPGTTNSTFSPCLLSKLEPSILPGKSPEHT